MARIIILPGDGIGPEVVREAQDCLALLSDAFDLELVFETFDFGGSAIDKTGSPLPDSTLEALRGADAILLGAVGGPIWSAAPETPEAGLLRLRSELSLFANLRPSRAIAGLENLSPLKEEIVTGADVLVVRELTGGIYFGKHHYSDKAASDLCSYRRDEIERVAHVAFQCALERRNRLTSVDKANVLATSKLWRTIINEVASVYPGVTVNHLFVDAAAMELVSAPSTFDVILTDNLFGDILSDELSVLGGSIGLLASASLGEARPFLFEPVHGSAPQIAGLDLANPTGAIESAAMLLELGLGMFEPAALLRSALEATLVSGCRTLDLKGDASCSYFGSQVRHWLERHFEARGAHLELIQMNRGCCG